MTNQTKKRLKQSRFVLHPFFFSLYPILSLWAFNIYQVDPRETFRVFLVLPIIALLLLLLWNTLIKNWHRAGLLTLFYLILFFTYSHLTEYVQRPIARNLGLALGDFHRYFLSIMATAVIVGSWWMWRIVRRDLSRWTEVLNAVTAVSLLLPLWTIISYNIQSPNIQPTNQVTQTTHPAKQPDIYYIILDAYTRADILQELYSYDNSPFLNALDERGFYVAAQSHSNYGQTALSVASTLNFEYLDGVAEQLGKDSIDRIPLGELLQHSQVRHLLEGYGYRTVAIATGWAFTEIRDADVYLSPGLRGLNGFERTLLNTTLPGALYNLSLSHTLKRQSVLFVLDAMKEAAEIPGPNFIFVHLTSPHDPFVFGPNGEPVDISQQYVAETGGFNLTPETFRAGYTGEITYLNQRVIEVVDYILNTSETQPVILIQGDHGSGLFLDWASVENTCARERLSILNAYLVPEEVKKQLYHSITPVNTFRLLFDSLFKTQLGLLPDQSYFSTWARPYDFVDVTNRLGQVCSQ